MEVSMFPVADLFADEDDDDPGSQEVEQQFSERKYTGFPGKALIIREFAFHALNANLVWPGAQAFAEWLAKRPRLLEGRRILELGSGTGALAIYMKLEFGCDITTSDYNDGEIELNIAYNCQRNGLPPLPHIRHTWGDDFLSPTPPFDLIVASDILLYVKQYPKLIQTLQTLLERRETEGNRCDVLQIIHSADSTFSKLPEMRKEARGSELKKNKEEGLEPLALPRPCFLMSWRRRIPAEDEGLFFKGCTAHALQVQDLGSRVFCIYPAHAV